MVLSLRKTRIYRQRVSSLLPLKTLPIVLVIYLSILTLWRKWSFGEGWRAFDEGFWSIAEGRSRQVLVGAINSCDLGQARDLYRIGIEPLGKALAFLLEVEQALSGNQKNMGKISQKIFARKWKK